MTQLLSLRAETLPPLTSLPPGSSESHQGHSRGAQEAGGHRAAPQRLSHGKCKLKRRDTSAHHQSARIQHWHPPRWAGAGQRDCSVLGAQMVQMPGQAGGGFLQNQTCSRRQIQQLCSLVFPQRSRNSCPPTTCTWTLTAAFSQLPRPGSTERACGRRGVNKWEPIQTVGWYSALTRNELSGQEKTRRKLRCMWLSGRGRERSRLRLRL